MNTSIKREIAYEAAYLMQIEEKTRLVATATAIYYIVRDRLRHLVCKYKGHRWEDDSYATPDYGCVSISCTRCGESHHTTLY